MTDENLRRSIRAIGIFHYFISFLILVGGGILPLAVVVRTDELSTRHIGILLVIGLAVFYFFLARGLRQFKPWARTVTMVISCIGLLRVPIGTITNGAFLYVLLKGKHLFQHGADTAGAPPPIPIDRNP